LCLRQFLVYEDGLARLSDFAASGYEGHDALGVENASHYMPRDPEQPNSVESDLFALGSTLYELMAGKPPCHDKSDVEIESLYKQEEFPCIEDILCGELILRCWRREFKSADEVLAAFNDCVPLRREHPSKNQPLGSNSPLDQVEGRHIMLGKISIQAPRLKL
jgi:serine/threonine protein kinase